MKTAFIVMYMGDVHVNKQKQKCILGKTASSRLDQKQGKQLVWLCPIINYFIQNTYKHFTQETANTVNGGVDKDHVMHVTTC